MAITNDKNGNMFGLSSDTKPTAPAGYTFLETDTGLLWTSNGTAFTLGGSLISKTVTFTGASNLGAVGAVPLFTVTGQILVEKILGYCVTDLTQGAPTATLALGVVGSTSLFIAATTATLIVNPKFWVSNTPTAAGIALPAACFNIIVGANIIGTVASQSVATGVLRVDMYWKPLSGGSVVAS